MEHVVKILFTEFVTHDVKSFVLERPSGYTFKPGQANELSINKPEWKNEKRPFTFTSYIDDPVLQFTIKAYPDHHGVTEQLHKLKPGDELILREAWGTITYKGPGVFLAAGAGVTPFIGILRYLFRDGKLPGHQLIFSNKTKADIIREPEFTNMFKEIPNGFVNTLSREEAPGYEHGRITKELLQKYVPDFKKHFYICGPKPFVADMKTLLADMGADTESIVFEE